MDKTAYRFLQFGDNHPPTLLKLSASSSVPTGPPPSSQSFTEAFTQSAAQSLRVRCSATRLMSGQQHHLDFNLDSEGLLRCVRASTKNQRFRLEEAVEALFEAVEGARYEASYDEHSAKCKVGPCFYQRSSSEVHRSHG